MPYRVPVQAIFVQRDGKLVRPKLGEKFEFTNEELGDINRMNPSAITKVVTGEIQDEDPKIARAREEQARRDAEEQRQAEARAEQERAERLAKVQEEEAARQKKETEQAEANKKAAASAKTAAAPGKGKGAASADSL